MILLGQLAALGAAMAWTITSLFDEHFTKGVWAPSVNFLRLSLGLVFVSLLSLMVSGQVLVVPAETEGAIWLILSGLIAFAVGDNFLILAFQMIGARITMLIFSISPIMTAVAGYLIFGETLSPFNFLGMILTLSGLVLVITAKSDTGQKQYSPIGVQAALLASVGQSAGVIFSKLGLETFTPIAGTQIRLFSAVMGLILYFTVRKQWAKVRKVRTHPHAWKAVLGDAFFATLIGVSLSMYALQHVKAAIASTLMSIMPVLIIPISIWLKEQIRWKEIAGAVLSVLGIAILFL